MKKLTAFSVLFAGGVFLFCASSFAGTETLPTKARGLGSMAFVIEEHHAVLDDGEEPEGRAMIDFTIDTDENGAVTGSLLVGAEAHHPEGMYPDIIIRVPSINDATFTEHTVTFRASGNLHDDPVKVVATAYDGAADGKTDSFRIRVTGDDEEVMFEAEGELINGNISVGEDEE